MRVLGREAGGDFGRSALTQVAMRPLRAVPLAPQCNRGPNVGQGLAQQRAMRADAAAASAEEIPLPTTP